VTALSKSLFTFILILSIILVSKFIYSQNDPVLFENAFYEFNTGEFNNSRYPVDSRLADLDNDGDLDVVVSQYTFTSGFAVLLNDGKGFFSQPNKYNSTEDSDGIEVGDFNNDNFIDVVVTNTGFNWEGNTISLFFNNGTGFFSQNGEYTVGNGPTGITADDFDNDNDLDLAVVNYGYLGQGSTVSVYINNGNGSFISGGTFASGVGPYRIESGFIDNDNLIDLVIANENQKLNVLLNSGNNDFSNKTEYDVEGNYGGNAWFNVELADMDNDIDIDILYSSTRTWDGVRGQVAYFKNNGDGTFASPVRIDLVDYTAGATDVGTGDLNEDGWLDIVAASFAGTNTDGYQVVYSDGLGGFQNAFKNPAGQATRSISIGDANGDDKPDIITIDNYGLGVTVHLNQGDGIFDLPPLFPTSYFATAMDAADIDLDGDLDVTTSANGYTAVGSPVAVILNNGDGTFGEYNTEYSVRSGGVQAKFRDLNGDNYPDLLFATSRASPPYDFHTALNNGDGTFATTQTWPIGSCGWADIDAFDVDNDNDLDVIITEWLGCPGIPESARRIYINLNNGNGTFQSPLIDVVNPFPSHIAGADLNKDGKIDLVTCQGASVDIHLGNGNGTFQSPTSYQLSESARDVVIDDLNNDNNFDIATCNFGSQGFMNVLFGNEDGTFGTAQEYYLAYSPDLTNASGITIGDIDQDGDKDIIVGNNASNGISVYLNTGNSSFEYRMRYGIYFDIYAPYFGDFDEDGINDIGAVAGIPPSGLQGAITFIKGMSIRPTSVNSEHITTLKEYRLEQNYPNPFNPYTSISYSIPNSSNVTIRIFDILGSELETLVSEKKQAGTYKVTWNAESLPSGIYFYQLKAGSFVETKKMVLMK